MIIKLEKQIMEYSSRVEKLLKQGFSIIGLEEDSIVLFRPDRSS